MTNLDFRQASELLAMFGGQPGEISLVLCTDSSGHSGEGLYAFHTEHPEEGSVFLGKADPDAVPEHGPTATDAHNGTLIRSVCEWLGLHAGRSRRTDVLMASVCGSIEADPDVLGRIAQLRRMLDEIERENTPGPLQN